MNATDTARTIEHRVGEHGQVSVRLADWDAEIRGIDGDTARIWNADGGDLPAELQVDRDADGILIRQYDKTGLAVVLGRRSRGVRLAIELPRTASLTIQSASGDAQASDLRGPISARTNPACLARNKATVKGAPFWAANRFPEFARKLVKIGPFKCRW